MTEEELRAQLEAKIRDHLASTFELMRERRAEREVLSDEEWWSLVKGSEFHHSMAERLEEMKEQMLAGRHERIAAERSGEAEESMIQMKVSEIFPVLFELRRESGETGSITDDEYHQASVGGSLSQIERVVKKMEGSLDQIQDPRKKAIVQKLSEMAKSDLPHLKRLQDPGVTEEDLTAFSDRSVGNLGELMELITAPMRRTPDPSELAESMETQTLFRPVGQAELDLIESSGWKEFPPRLPIQPIFYPVLELEYARQIARDWNTKDATSGYVGYVTEFDVRKTFLARYEIQKVGGKLHLEYWIPAGELPAFNEAIVGEIRVVDQFRSQEPT